MIKHWFRKVGAPLVIAFVAAIAAASLESGALALVFVLALAWAVSGGRDYRLYRSQWIRAEASRDARAALRR
jgi:hypothetical protein